MPIYSFYHSPLIRPLLDIMKKDFCYVYNSELDIPVKIKLSSLFGFLENYVVDRYQQPSGHMFLKIAVYCNGRKVGCDVQTSFQAHDSPLSNREIQRWDEWCQLPIKYSELSRDACLHLTLWDVGETIEPVRRSNGGCCTIRANKGLLRGDF